MPLSIGSGYMQPEVRKLLYDMLHAAMGIEMFVDGRSRDDLDADLMLRLAIERQFEIIGEAMGRLRRIDVATAEQISEHQRIIGLRNVLIHGYDVVSNDIIWGIVQNKLPTLRRELEELLKSP